MAYTRDLVRWGIAADMIFSSILFGNNQFLNEVPMAEYLDQIIKSENSPVSGYMFVTMKLDTFLLDDDTHFLDYSLYNKYTVNIFAVAENFRDNTYD